MYEHESSSVKFKEDVSTDSMCIVSICIQVMYNVGCNTEGSRSV